MLTRLRLARTRAAQSADKQIAKHRMVVQKRHISSNSETQCNKTIEEMILFCDIITDRCLHVLVEERVLGRDLAPVKGREVKRLLVIVVNEVDYLGNGSGGWLRGCGWLGNRGNDSSGSSRVALNMKAKIRCHLLAESMKISPVLVSR